MSALPPEADILLVLLANIAGGRLWSAPFSCSGAKRLANLLGWLRRARPDVVCLQELKATDPEFPIAAIEKAGYGAVCRGKKSWNGVAILA
jgi:Endonuclease/Exonuclease/phosphatase family